MLRLVMYGMADLKDFKTHLTMKDILDLNDTLDIKQRLEYEKEKAMWGKDK